MPGDVIHRVEVMVKRDGKKALLIFEDNSGLPIGDDEVTNHLIKDVVDITGVESGEDTDKMCELKIIMVMTLMMVILKICWLSFRITRLTLQTIMMKSRWSPVPVPSVINAVPDHGDGDPDDLPQPRRFNLMVVPITRFDTCMSG